MSEGQATDLQRQYMEDVMPELEKISHLPPKEHFWVYEQPHLRHRWVYELVTNSAVLDAVESVLGPDLILWSPRWFSKMPGGSDVVTWHQDDQYYGFDPSVGMTAWIALSESIPANGCLRVIPGSHKGEIMPAVETFGDSNSLARGQEIVDVDETRAVDLSLRPGEISLHHMRIIHGSAPNSSDIPRIGIAPRFVRPEVQQKGPNPPEGMLVRGKDQYGHFRLLDPPGEVSTEDDRERQRESIRRIRENTGHLQPAR